MALFGMAQIPLMKLMIKASSLISLILQPIRRMRQKQKLAKIAQVNGLKLDAEGNLESLFTLEEVFIQRSYADYFPFYKKVTILDVGAHKGYFSLFAFNNVLQGSTIIAVEPNGNNSSVLKKNLHQNQVSGVHVVHAAIHTSDEKIKLFTSESENHSLVVDTAKKNEFTVVQGIQLATLMADFQVERVDFLKLDCEGAEYEVLYKLPKAIYEKIEVISMEFHDLKQTGSTALDLADHLMQMGYEILKLEHRASHKNLNYGRLIARRLKTEIPAPK